MAKYRSLAALISEFPGIVQLGARKFSKEEAKFIGARAIKPILRDDPKSLENARDLFQKIAPKRANAYVWFKTYVEFYRVKPSLIEWYYESSDQERKS